MRLDWMGLLHEENENGCSAFSFNTQSEMGAAVLKARNDEIMIMTKRVISMIVNMTSTRMRRISLKILTIMTLLSKTVKIYNARSRPDLFLSISHYLFYFVLSTICHICHICQYHGRHQQFVLLVNGQ